LFETILYQNGKLLYWKQHYQRLQSSADKLKMVCPDELLLLNDIENILKDTAANTILAIKIIISRGAGERGYQFKAGNSLTRIVMASAIDTSVSNRSRSTKAWQA
jgi:branched-subunit amino acid aminotransferase/4-amino-4-deoxychorismate lyase